MSTHGPDNLLPIQSLLNETIEFLKKIKLYFEQEIAVLESTAVADTRFVTALFDKTAVANLEKSLAKLTGYYDTLGKPSATFEAKEVQDSLKKCVHFLLRTQNFLDLTTKNNQAGAQFIPVPAHKKIAKDNQEQLEKCNELLDKFLKYQHLVPTNKKGWFTFHQYLGNLLSFVRAGGFGFALKDKQAPQLHLENAVKELNNLEQLKDNQVVLTKTTQRMMGSHSFKEEPTSELFKSHMPKELTLAFQKFRTMMGTTQELTKDVVLKAVEVNYPHPKMKV